MKTNLAIVLVLGLFFSHKLYADSPLTSTNFSKAYQTSKIVRLASKADGVLTPKLMKFLSKSKKPLELKMAVINELGWDFDGKNNSSLFLEYLKEKKKLKSLDDASADILICYAYLKALDNYFDVRKAITYATMAKLRNKKSYIISIIYALIEAKKAFDHDWCKVYKLTNNVRLNKTLDNDMQEAAKAIIFDYMDIYKGDCKEKS